MQCIGHHVDNLKPPQLTCQNGRYRSSQYFFCFCGALQRNNQFGKFDAQRIAKQLPATATYFDTDVVRQRINRYKLLIIKIKPEGKPNGSSVVFIERTKYPEDSSRQKT